MSTDLNGNSRSESLKKVNENKKLLNDDDAVVLVIQGEEEKASNDNLSRNLPTSSSLLGTNSFYDISSPNKEEFSATTNPKENIFNAPITANTPLMASPGPTREEEDIEEDEDFYTTAKTPLMASPGPAGGEDDEEDDDIYRIEPMENRHNKLKPWDLIEWIALACIMGTLISSLTIDKLDNFKILELHLWKWCVLLLVIVNGRLFTAWFINALVFLIERNFRLRKKVLYFVYGLRKTVQACIWLASVVLLSYVFLFDGRIKRSARADKILKYVTRALVAFLVALVMWLIKNILMKILAASVNANSFYVRIQESLFHQYVLRTLSGPPRKESSKNIRYSKSPGQLSFKKEGKEQEVIDVAKLHKLKQDKVSSWTKKLVSNVISSTKLSTISNPIEELYDVEGAHKHVEITSEWEAKVAASRIFKNVAEPGSKYICEDDLLRFFSKEELWNVFPQFEGAVETGRIKKTSLKKWVVNVYRERKSLAHTLNDANAVVKQLNKVVSILLLIMFVMMWLISMGLATTEVVLFISSQIFVFGNTTKAVFEGIIFVFYTNPFDVGDRCVIDGVQLVVEEMNIMTTVFLKIDNQKIYYPNVVLASKCIGNMYRSPEMGDTVEFVVDASTSVESIGVLKAKIKAYIESKPHHWRPNHRVVVLEIENVDKMKMALYVTHTINHQDMDVKTVRRSDLILNIKKLFDELGMRYHLLPQEVPVGNANG